ncbi:MAG: CinA family protein [Deltaproteobacteria bacterium]|nr:CinA family protein [Deltaproteobacteria bacterium]MBZ0218866.1 CinA family protein [Deltaproteobacteria bacterium]
MTLPVIIGEALRKKGLKLAVAESCTGGLLSSMITDIPGSSDYFEGAIVAYANDVKAAMLGVKSSTLASYGAVSRKTAGEMAQGARKSFKADISAAVTGIAGPGGGTPKKPVGLVFIAVSKGSRTTVKRFLFKGGRKAVKKQSAEAALEMLGTALGIKRSGGVR